MHDPGLSQHAHLTDDVSAREMFPYVSANDWAQAETDRLARYGDGLGEPIHPFVQQAIKNALLAARDTHNIAGTPEDLARLSTEPGVLTDKVSER